MKRKEKKSLSKAGLEFWGMLDLKDADDTKDPKEIIRGNFHAVLDLSQNKIKDAKIIYKALKVNTALKELNLAYNKIENGKAISEVPKINKMLMTLNLMDNNLANKGARIIGEMIKVNKTLVDLNASLNEIEDTEEIFEGLKFNRPLKVLKLKRIG